MQVIPPEQSMQPHPISQQYYLQNTTSNHLQPQFQHQLRLPPPTPSTTSFPHKSSTYLHPSSQLLGYEYIQNAPQGPSPQFTPMFAGMEREKGLSSTQIGQKRLTGGWQDEYEAGTIPRAGIP